MLEGSSVILEGWCWIVVQFALLHGVLEALAQSDVSLLHRAVHELLHLELAWVACVTALVIQWRLLSSRRGSRCCSLLFLRLVVVFGASTHDGGSGKVAHSRSDSYSSSGGCNLSHHTGLTWGSSWGSHSTGWGCGGHMTGWRRWRGGATWWWRCGAGGRSTEHAAAGTA